MSKFLYVRNLKDDHSVGVLRSIEVPIPLKNLIFTRRTTQALVAYNMWGVDPDNVEHELPFVEGSDICNIYGPERTIRSTMTISYPDDPNEGHTTHGSELLNLGYIGQTLRSLGLPEFSSLAEFGRLAVLPEYRKYTLDYMHIFGAVGSWCAELNKKNWIFMITLPFLAEKIKEIWPSITTLQGPVLNMKSPLITRYPLYFLNNELLGNIVGKEIVRRAKIDMNAHYILRSLVEENLPRIIEEVPIAPVVSLIRVKQARQDTEKSLPTAFRALLNLPET